MTPSVKARSGLCDSRLARRQREAPVVRYQWDNGNKLELRPLDERLWKLVRKLVGAPRSAYRTELRRSERAPLYVALHWTFDPVALLRPGKLFWRSVRNVTLCARHVERGWWIGAHIAEPRPHLLVVTPPLGTLAELSPPAMSRRWALQVDSFNSFEARAWATRKAAACPLQKKR